MTTTLASVGISTSRVCLCEDRPPPSELPPGRARRKRPPTISEKVAGSIRNAEETCVEDAASGECAAAWDEVEELTAAVSHPRDNLMADDPLE
ncbi:unnamed protein product, partial [Musa hybrid cultivar]